jgi:hypothetical protein
MLYICLIQTNEGTYILCGDDKYCIRAFHTQQEAIDYWEVPYKEAHARGYGASMSACLSFIMKRPSIISIPSTEDEFKVFLEPLVAREDGELQLFHCRDVSGGFHGILCSEEAVKHWEGGTKPTLIKREWGRDAAEKEFLSFLEEHA